MNKFNGLNRYARIAVKLAHSGAASEIEALVGMQDATNGRYSDQELAEAYIQAEINSMEGGD